VADTRAVVRDVSRRADNDSIMSVIEEAGKTGIDCPLGWPDAFVRFVAAHHCGQADMPGSGISAGWQQELTMRRTDACRSLRRRARGGGLPARLATELGSVPSQP
jgi:hypothetical protein